MAWWQNFRSRRSPVYGLPTGWGLLLFLQMACAFYFSAFNQSLVAQWISIVMVILTLLHLAESNNPFRWLQLSILSFDPPFAKEPILIPIEIQNPSDLASNDLQLRIRSGREKLRLPAIAPRSHSTVTLSMPSLPPGKHPLPPILLETWPRSRLFRVWRSVRPDDYFFVLPQALDHGLPLEHFIPSKNQDGELSHLDLIQDERLISQMDQKIFLKTGKAYIRVIAPSSGEDLVKLDWSRLAPLARKEQGEQFSAWLKQCQSLTGSIRVQIRSPFYEGDHWAGSTHWTWVHQQFAEWFYAQT